VAAALDKSVYLKEEKLLDAFAAFDTDGSGKISSEELMKILGSKIFSIFFNFFKFFNFFHFFNVFNFFSPFSIKNKILF